MSPEPQRRTEPAAERPLRVVLVAPPLLDMLEGRLVPIAMDRHRTNPPYGIYMLASLLRARGHQVTLADLIISGSTDLAPFAQAICEADLVGIGTTSLSWPAARDCVTSVRSLHKGVPIVLGGIHATMFDYYLLENFPIDYVIRGEAEEALPALCEFVAGTRSIDETPSLTARNGNGKAFRTRLAPALPAARISDFPLPDYSQVPAGVYPGLAIESSRGCPFDCCFCSTSYRRSWRALDTTAFVDRLEAISLHLDRTSAGHIQIVDDEFSIDRERVVRIVREIERRHLAPKFIFNARVNDVLHEDLVLALGPYTKQFLVGAECGYDEGLRRVGKGTTCERIEAAARSLAAAGLEDRAHFSFVLGLPWETKDDVIATLRFACRLHATYGVCLMLQWYCQIPGSRLWCEAHRKGVISPAFYDDYGFFRDPYLFLTGIRLSPAEVTEVSRALEPVVTLSRVRHTDEQRIAYSHPWVVARYFSDSALSRNDAQGLGSLVEVSRAVPEGVASHGRSPIDAEDASAQHP
ncbi:Anaerobic magnesium-protoporphyrin IX monomethyl ester cyclase [Planctomycetaceae bacterium]|nr:Anaerobic magnesium-protoporphyrin IX monomethyl ester cyclase [Planctomycetaceae bacterium]